MYVRNLAGKPEYENALEFRFGDTADTIAYSTTVPHESWMTDVYLDLFEDLCGCGRESEKKRFIDLGPYALEKYNPDIRYSYVVPEATIKTDTICGRAYLDFPVNRTVIRPKYRNNEKELAKIIATMDEVKNDSTLTIRSIHIHGYASPEATWKTNTRLAKGRTAALAKYVADYLGIPADSISTEFTPEDWEGLASRLPSSKVVNKEKILEVIAGDMDPDAKEYRIKAMYPDDYALMLKEIYPALRHSDYTVTYEVQAFDVEEAKKMLQIFPKRLNLNEMYVVAQEYAPGSREFNHVFDVAVRMYPENSTANLNAANIAISEGNYERAATYLRKAGKSPKADHARALLAMMNRDYEVAERLLTAAKEAGIEEAEHNLNELKLFMINDYLYMTPEDEGRNPMSKQ